MEASDQIKPAISVRNLCVGYAEREILHGISFDVRTAETLVILGGSGSGKSTLLRTLVGLQKPNSGEVWIKGIDTTRISEREMDALRLRMGMSFQGGALFGSMTVGENVALPLREHTKLEESTIEIMVRIKLGHVGMGKFQDYMPSQLSGGMRKRAAFARALAMDPDVVFFDEPSAGLDPIVAAGLDQLMLNLKKAYSITMVVVTHELASAFLIADRMILLDRGRILAMGSGDELRANAHPRVQQFLGRVPESEVEEESDTLMALTGDRANEASR